MTQSSTQPPSPPHSTHASSPMLIDDSPAIALARSIALVSIVLPFLGAIAQPTALGWRFQHLADPGTTIIMRFPPLQSINWSGGSSISAVY